MRTPAIRIILTATVFAANLAHAEYPVQRPARKAPAPAESSITVHPDRPKQTILGFGFEIQSDSIGSGNVGLPDATTSVPHDLVPSERQRFYQEMLRGFRYCRLAGGLYWRGLDPEKKFMSGRWPEQMDELRGMIESAGIEGVSLEYWSPAPFWKTNGAYVGADRNTNILRCFGPDFANDPGYHGDADRFFKDFSAALVHDLAYLREHRIPVKFWGLQNEPRPWNAGNDYSRCVYNDTQYDRAFSAVAPAIRAFDPGIRIIADSWDLNCVARVLRDPKRSPLVDALVIHQVGSDSNIVLTQVPALRAKHGPEKPIFQNEYEYLAGPTSPARCLNTVQHIMNWFQAGEAPTWFWIHALKPIKNKEASGYSLGFWRPAADTAAADHPDFPGLKPGHWQWNKYNWHAVGSFIRHMPWDCRAVAVTEPSRDNDLRVLAFKRPNGKLTVVLSNRSFGRHRFNVETGLTNATFKGWRYTPDDAGDNFTGSAAGTLNGGTISPDLADMSWEFWEEQ